MLERSNKWAKIIKSKNKLWKLYFLF
jgi:hypothetical protein